MVNAPAARALSSVTDPSPTILRSDGSGSLQDSRGTLIVQAQCDATRQMVDPQCGQPITGNETAQGGMFDAGSYANGTWDGTSWYTSQWQNASVTGTSWYGTSWYGTSWYSYEANQGEAWDGNSAPNTIGGINAPASGIYGLWR
jgi:hypothetical protein